MKLLIHVTLIWLFASVGIRAQTGKLSVVPDTSYSQRDTFVTLSIVADGNVKNVKALQIDLDVTSSVIFADTLHVSLGSFFVINSDSTFFHFTLSPDKSRLTLDWAILGDGKTRSGPGTMAQIRFKTVGFGTSDVAIAAYKLRDSLNQPMVVNVKNGWVKVCRYVGDINADNRIDLADLTALVAYLATGAPDPVPNAVANVNCFGIVDLADLSQLVGYLTSLGTICQLCL